MSEIKGPQYGTRQAQGDHGVDLDALRGTLDTLHSIPQLAAGVNGKLSRVAPEKPEPRELTEDEAKGKAIEALAQCVAQAEGNFIDKSLRKVFRDDCIGLSYNRRFRLMHQGDLKPMADMLRELQIEIQHLPPDEGYTLPEDCLLYRRLAVIKGGRVRAEQVWEWKAG